MNTFFEILREYQELAIFLMIALGFAIGSIPFGSFKLGTVLGCLFAGVLIGQIGVQVAPVVKAIFFDLFLFATGYKVGPQFFRGLKKDALPQLTLTAVICTTCLLTAFAISKLFSYDMGTTAGLLAGAFSESTVIGTAGEAIQKLSISEEEKLKLLNNIPVAYAVTYLIGTTTLVWFLSSLAPKILRINLKDACRELEEKLEGKAVTEPGIDIAFQEWSIRAFILTSEKWVGRTIEDFENSLPDQRFFIQRIRHNGIIQEPDLHTVLRSGDTIALMARRAVILESLSSIGTETIDKELMDFPFALREIIVSKKAVLHQSLGHLALKDGRGVVLRSLKRGGYDIPFNRETKVDFGDVLTVSGRLTDIENVAKKIGVLESVSPASDMIFVGAGIVLGGLIGLLSVKIAGIDLSFSVSGGALIMGLIFGWVQSKTKLIGRIPEAALWIFDNVGLAVFIGLVGLSAGPSFISGLKQTGFGIILAGLIVAILPQLTGLLFGKYILKVNPVILLGCLSGAGTTTAGLKAIQDAAGSKLPVLGYTIPYALGNILLTAWGPAIVAMMS